MRSVRSVERPEDGVDLPLVTGLKGTLVDHLTTSTAACLCNPPCTVSYAVTGTRL